MTCVKYVCCVLAIVIAQYGPSATAVGAAQVLTYHNDAKRTGWNKKETKLTPATLRSGLFTLQARTPLDGQVDAEPLVDSDVGIAGSKRNVVYAVTEADTVYAIDGDTGEVLLQRRLGTPVEAGKGKPIDCGNNASSIGITSTPVIDEARHAIDLVAFVWESGTPEYRLFSLDLSTLIDRVAPKTIEWTDTLSSGEKVVFDPKISRQRSALTLTDNKIIAAFASFCDHDANRSRGIVLGWNADDLAMLTPVVLLDRRASAATSFHLASIWMSGAGPAVDDDGNIYVVTSNSSATRVAASNTDLDQYFAESLVRLPKDLRGVDDYFKPHDFNYMDITDNDLGSGGTLVIPDNGEGKLIAAAGKTGHMYLLDRTALGKLSQDAEHEGYDRKLIGKCWCSEAYYQGPDRVEHIVSSGGATLTSWKLVRGVHPMFVKEWDAQSTLGTDVFQKGFFTAVSSDGLKADTALIWAVQRPTAQPPTLTLWAFEAKTGVALLAFPAGPWPNTGGSANTVPVIANGHVYVASYGEIRVYGLQPESAAITPTAALPAPEHDGYYGTVHSASGNDLTIDGPHGLVQVSIGDALANHKTVTLTPGIAIRVLGEVGADGKIVATSIDYAPQNPSLWKDIR